jgi:hypothetical protein
MPKFPSTKDERFLLGIAKTSLKLSDGFFEWVQWKKVAQELNLGEKSCENIVNILARTALVQKKDECVKLTVITMRHYGDDLCQICKVGTELQQEVASDEETEEERGDL